MQRCILAWCLATCAIAVEGAWRLTPTPLPDSRDYCTATLLPTGEVLVSGGGSGPGPYISPNSRSLLFNPVTEAWTVTGSLAQARYEHSATLLADGRVLVVGGRENAWGPGSSVCEIYDRSSGAWTSVQGPGMALTGHAAHLLPTGRVLVAGGYDLRQYENSTRCHLFDPRTLQWKDVERLPDDTHVLASTMLSSGECALFTCENARTREVKIQYFDPSTERWVKRHTLGRESNGMSVAELYTGALLVMGGVSDTSDTVCQLLEPYAAKRKSTVHLFGARQQIPYVMLRTGKVLVCGGNASLTNYGTDRCELYDPVANAWSQAAPLLNAGGTFVRLASGKVMQVRGNRSYIYSGPLDAPKVMVSAQYSANPKPTWNWLSSGGGNGSFRWKLDDDDFSGGYLTGPELNFIPGAPLAEGSHTLFVQEQDSLGNWSPSGSGTCVVDTVPPRGGFGVYSSPAYAGMQYHMLLEFTEPIVGLTKSDIIVVNGKLNALIPKANGRAFDAYFTFDKNGEIYLESGCVSDLANNTMLMRNGAGVLVEPQPSSATELGTEPSDASGCGAGAIGALIGTLLITLRCRRGRSRAFGPVPSA